MQRVAYLGIITFILFGVISACSTKCHNESETICNTEDCLSDTAATYLVMTYYDNGALKKCISIKNMQMDGVCAEFYNDGGLRRKIHYCKDIMIQFEDRRNTPQIISEHDSLKIGIKTRVRVLNLYPNERFGSMDNVVLEKLEDNSEYDYSITPQKADTALFYYETSYNDTVVLSANQIKKISAYGLTKEDLKGRSSVVIISEKRKSILLKVLPIYKRAN